MGSTGPVEMKVKAGTAAAAASAVILWALRTYAFAGVVPPEVEVFVDLAAAGLATFAAGWFTRHTPRRDPDALPPTGEYATFDDDPDDGRHSRHEP